MFNQVRIHLTFFGLVELVAVGLIVFSLFPGVKWYGADLYLPDSLNPLHRNTSTELSVSSKWGVETVEFDVYRFKEVHGEFNISSLTSEAFLATFAGVPENTLILLHDIQRASDFTFSSSLLAIGLLLFGGVSALLVSVSPCLWNKTNRYNRSVCWLCKPVSILPGICAVVAVSSLVAAVVGFLGSAHYLVTLETDARVVLPSLLEKLRYLCLMHPKGQCFVKVKILTGVILYIVGVVLALISSMAYFVIWGAVVPYSAFDSDLREVLLRRNCDTRENCGVVP